MNKEDTYNGIRRLIIYGMPRQKVIDFIRRRAREYYSTDFSAISGEEIIAIAIAVDKKLQAERNARRITRRFSVSLLFLFSSAFMYLYAQNGCLVLNNNPYLVFNSAATVYLVINNSDANAIRCLPSDNCYVGGRIVAQSETNKIKWHTETSIGNYIIPYYSGSMVPFGFNKTTAGTESSAGSGYLQATQWYTANNAVLPAGTSICGFATEADVIDRFWVIDVPGYTAKPAATLRFYYNLATDIETNGGYSEEALLAQRWNTANAAVCKWESPVGTSVSASDYVEVGTSVFSPWTLTNKNKPLPAQLITFRGECISASRQEIRLRWTTAAEINCRNFTIERSTNGISFENAGTKPATGNSSTLIHYDFTDVALSVREPLPFFYYRLKQTDFDGVVTYSDIIAVKSCVNTQQTSIESIFPGSEGEFVVVIRSSREQTFNLVFYNVLGQKTEEEIIHAQKGTNRFVLRSPYLAREIVLVRIYNQTENFIFRPFLN